MRWFRRLFSRSAPPEAPPDSPSDPPGGDPTTFFHGCEGAVSLVPFACELRGERADEVADRIEELLTDLSPTQVVRLDQTVRERSAWRGNWFGSRRLAQVVPRHLPAHEDPFLCLALAHRSGFVRQAAIERVEERLRSSDPFRHAALALRLLVLRRNDWVDAVTGAAASALDRLLPSRFVAEWVQALPLIDGLLDAGRRDHRAFVASVYDASRAATWADLLTRAMVAGERFVARAAARRALENQGLSRSEVLEVALRASDPTVRIIVVRAVAKDVPADGRESLLRRLEADPFLPVRREAFELRGRWFPDAQREACERLLFDRSRALRGLAQRVVTKLGGDPVGAYHRRLEEAPATMLAPTLLGLAEVGERGDAVRALPYLGSPHAATRAAAFRCLSSLAADEHADALARALEDPSPRVGRAAAAGLRGRAHLVGLDRLLAILEGSPPRHVRRIVIRLLYASDLWAALPPLVQAAAAKNGEDSAWAEGLLETWFARCRGWTSPPPPERITALREAVEACSDALPPRLRRELAFLLETIAKGSPRERR